MMARQAALSSLLLFCCSAFLWSRPWADAGYQSMHSATMYTTDTQNEGHLVVQETAPAYAPPEWFGMSDTTLGDGTDVEALDVFATYPVPGHEQVMPDRPGASLVSLAMVLQESDPQTRAALLRQFVHSVVKLKSPYVGLQSSATPSSSQASSTEQQVKVVEGKLDGILKAAESSSVTKKAMNAVLLIPFGVVMRDTEELLYNTAKKGDAVGMSSALNILGPMLVRGLSYLESGPSDSSTHIHTVRMAILERAKELDAALLEGQRDLKEVLRRYPVDMSDEALQHERSVAAIMSMNNGGPYVPPPIAQPYPMSPPPTTGRRVGKFLMAVLVVLAISSVASAFSSSRSFPRERHSSGESDIEERFRRSRDNFRDWVTEQRQDASGLYDADLHPIESSPGGEVRFEPNIWHAPVSEAVRVPSAPPFPYPDLPPTYEEAVRQGGRRS